MKAQKNKIEIQFLSSIEKLLTKANDSLMKLETKNKNIDLSTYDDSIKLLNDIFYYFITEVDKKLYSYVDNIDIWINNYITFRNYIDGFIFSNCFDDFNQEKVHKIIKELFNITVDISECIEDDIRYSNDVNKINYFN